MNLQMTELEQTPRPPLSSPLTNWRLSRAYESAPILTFDSDSRMVFMSDCHRGVGNQADNYTLNQNIFQGALTYYNNREFTYFELGDGDELWENRKYTDIIVNHCDTYSLMSDFYKNGRFYMLCGNHDAVKKHAKQRKLLSNSYNDCIRKKGLLFPGMSVYESLILQEAGTNHQILLAHGHQGDWMNDYLWWVARFLVRYVWRPLQLIGVQNPSSPTASNRKGNLLEQKMMKWTRVNRQPLICGHTHRPAYPEQPDTPYFNDGCCVSPYVLTAVEIERSKVSLVKWSTRTDGTLSLYIGREVLFGPRPLDAFFEDAD